ncbi:MULTISPECIES: restriction endonuclease subunit S [Aeromonas]|uniref:restriction endonuclease subunit S n=1 Tax=Aeromonas TaxID=642 RepID=UPI0011C04705|nr:restriction endonuclease subunit S [Aeromonas veronii]ELV7509810.1 hypothetical protein [Aeromonas veronii]
MEGLEITELMLSGLRAENDKLRIDSGYFSKPMLSAEQKIRRYAAGYDELGSLFSRFVKGIFDINSDTYVDDGIPFIRIQNLKDGLIDNRGMAFIPEDIHQSERKTELCEGDIVLSKTGYPAASIFVLERGNTSQDTIATTLSEYGKKHYRAPVVVAYLNSKYGQALLWRQFQGNVQLHLSLEDGRKVPIPRFSETLQIAIENCFNSAKKLRTDAALSIENAENILLHALGLDTWSVPEPLSYIRSSSEVFNATRLDAEHFQPRFQSLVELIDETGAGTKLGKHLLNNKRGKQPAYVDEGLPVVNSKHVLRNDVRLDADNRMAISEEGDLLIRPGDVLFNGTGVGTIGRSAAYLHETLAIPDNHVTILRPDKKLDPVYLALFLNSKAGQFQVEQRLRGSSGQIELYPNDIAEFSIWLAPTTLQQSVRQQVEQSFAQKQNAARLLDAAKRAVEIAIEESEAAAVAYLDNIVE